MFIASWATVDDFDMAQENTNAYDSVEDLATVRVIVLTSLDDAPMQKLKDHVAEIEGDVFDGPFAADWRDTTPDDPNDKYTGQRYARWELHNVVGGDLVAVLVIQAAKVFS